MDQTIIMGFLPRFTIIDPLFIPNGPSSNSAGAWNHNGGRQGTSRGSHFGPWSGGQQHTGMGSSNAPNNQTHEMHMLMNQVKQLQNKVMQLSNQQNCQGGSQQSNSLYAAGGGGGTGQSRNGGMNNTSYNNCDHPTRNNSKFVKSSNKNSSSGVNNPRAGNERTKAPIAPNGKRKILLVSNLPPVLANPDSVYYMFIKFGNVERVKILHNQRTTALVQMESAAMAEKAVEEQHSLNRTGTDIFVNFSTNVQVVRMPAEVGLTDDGLSKDFTGEIPYNPESHNLNSDMNGLLGPAPFLDVGDNSSYGPVMGAHNRGSQQANGPCLLVSSIPEDIANPDYLCNLFGFYGDVQRVKILRNKKDCAIIQMAKPHQATLCRNFLDQCKIGGKRICVSYSRMTSIKLPTDNGHDDDAKTKDFSSIKGVHRFRNPNLAHKLLKNLCAPTAMLHVANLPENFATCGKLDELKGYFVDAGFTVKDVQECGKDGSMSLIQLASVEEAISALAKLHNKIPEKIGTKKGELGLCISFSNRRDISKE